MKLMERISGPIFTRPPDAKDVESDRKHATFRAPFTHHNVDSAAQSRRWTGEPLADGEREKWMHVVPVLWLFQWQLNFLWHCAPDALPVLHFHGGRVVSLILWGGYEEERFDGRTGRFWRKLNRPFTINHIQTHEAHRLVDFPKKKCLTLVLIFPNVQKGGFLVNGKFSSFGRTLMEGHLSPVR